MSCCSCSTRRPGCLVERRQVLIDDQLVGLSERLVAIRGITGVMLGGSRARGEHAVDSDVDLGLYYRPPLDVAGLRKLARELAGPQAEVTKRGAWGPWVDGGGWLTIADTAVDWLYRDLRRVHASCQNALAGRLEFHFQVGHPMGVLATSYAGEVALGVVLADPSGELSALQEQVATYPAALGDALVARLWEAGFILDALPKAASRGDTAYVAGCLFRVVELCAYALHGRAGRWLINEKGAVTSAGRLPQAPADFVSRANDVLARLGAEIDELTAAIRRAADLLTDVTDACMA
jgi:predicted nucleotidyltransferase